jgi:hypothetical protein
VERPCHLLKSELPTRNEQALEKNPLYLLTFNFQAGILFIMLLASSFGLPQFVAPELDLVLEKV